MEGRITTQDSQKYNFHQLCYCEPFSCGVTDVLNLQILTWVVSPLRAVSDKLQQI